MRKIIFIMTVACSLSSYGGPFDLMERAVMPGDISAAHAKYEKKCGNCHEPFDKKGQERLCRKCHKKVNVDLVKKKGYHGISPEVKGKNCRICHTEHKGRSAKIMLLDKETFNHTYTDFPLRNSHKKTECKNCHKKPTDKKKVFKYRDAEGSCVKCHKKDEPHKGRLGKLCQVCHRESQWRDFAFNHDKTKFPLKGKHQGVQCKDCHPSEQYLHIPKNCVGCHKLDDKHKGQFGAKCKKCHAPKGWFDQTFNHNRQTKFKLTFKHKNVSCGQCHKGENIYKEKLGKACYTCHKLDDVHKGRNGKKCENCHSPRDFSKNKFDHDKTDFPLKGKHKDVSCKDCHRGELKEKLPKKCYGCHKHKDPHRGQQGKKCINCHNERGWLQKVVFDHGSTKFPLLGAHASVSCDRCHLSSTFKDTKRACGNCHKKDDYHKGTLGIHCANCHYTSSDWKVWSFKHDKQTKFALKGAHKNLVCRSCHRVAVDKVKQNKNCISCHSLDDKHAGAFGRFCDQCHNTESFSKLNEKFK